MPKTMQEITKFYLMWTEPTSGRNQRNRHLTQLGELIEAIDDNPDSAGHPHNAALAAIDKITEHMADSPNARAKKVLNKIIRTNLHKANSRVNALEMIKHLCLVEGGEEGKRGSVNPPGPWKL